MGKEERINIKKLREEIRASEKEVDRSKSLIGCYCTHQFPNGSLSIVAAGGNDGQRGYKCTRCGKMIQLDAPKDEDIEKAIDVIDAMCDIVKFTADPKSESDQKIVNRVIKAQIRTTKDLKKYYMAAKENAKRNRNRGQRHNNDDVTINRPTSY